MSKAYHLISRAAWHVVCWAGVTITIYTMWWLIIHGLQLLILSLGGQP